MMRLVNALVAAEDSMTALCEEYGVSRRIGYKWLSRFRAEGLARLTERSRAPHVVPWAVSQAQADAVVGLRRQHPSWGLLNVNYFCRSATIIFAGCRQG